MAYCVVKLTHIKLLVTQHSLTYVGIGEEGGINSHGSPVQGIGLAWK